MRFGEFVKEKRLAQGMTLRRLANEIGIAPAYMSDIEKGYRYPPNKDKLYSIATILNLTDADRDLMFDLAGCEKENAISPDLPEYIMQNRQVRVALRRARDCGMGDDFWQDLIDKMEHEQNKDTE